MQQLLGGGAADADAKLLHELYLQRLPGNIRMVLASFGDMKTLNEQVKYVLGIRTRIFCLAPASQCVNTPTEAARARAAILTAREARLPTHGGS